MRLLFGQYFTSCFRIIIIKPLSLPTPLAKKIPWQRCANITPNALKTGEDLWEYLHFRLHRSSRWDLCMVRGLAFDIPKCLGWFAFTKEVVNVYLLSPKKEKHMCQGLNSHYFHIIGDGHQPNSRGLYTHYKDSQLKVGWPSPKYCDFWPWHI